MKLENGPLNILVALFVVAVISTSVVVPALAISSGITPKGANFVIVEGTAGSDYYDNTQYSYKINQWFADSGCDNCKDGDYSFNLNNMTYFNAKKSLRLGFTEYGEFATSDFAGIAYGATLAEWSDTESWASTKIAIKDWIQGWTLFINYSLMDENLCLMAWAIYSNRTASEGGRNVISWPGQFAYPGQSGSPYWYGTLTPEGVKVLYDSARLFVGRTAVTITEGKNNDDLAKVVITVVYNKDSKYAIVYKDLKILAFGKGFDWISDIAFSERYEIDLAANLNPTNDAYVHYYSASNSSENCTFVSDYMHPLTGESAYDVLQAYDRNRKYIFFAAYWPNATEYDVKTSLVPNPLLNQLRILPYGWREADEAVEPTTPYVVVQWRYNSTHYPNLLDFLTNADNKQIRFVEVIGMTDRKNYTYGAKDANDLQAGVNHVDMEVQYLLSQVFNPEDLNDLAKKYTTSEVGAPFMWVGLGQSAATTDSAGAAMLGGNQYGTYRTAFPLFDRADEMFPWINPVIGMRGTIPYGLQEFGGNYIQSFSSAYGTEYYRTALKKFAFNYYDDDYWEPPQPIAGGWSYYGDYWYPSKDPLTERWTSNTAMDPYENVTYHPNGILTIGGMKANGLTRYFNDFYFAISREGPDAYAYVDYGELVGTPPTSNPELGTFDYFPISTWRTNLETFNYREGYAVISLARDVNGTRGLSVYGWDGRDTFWASAWASQYVLSPNNDWLPDGAVAIILYIDYNGDNMEPAWFCVEKVLGTITEFGWNDFTESGYSFDLFPTQLWNGAISPPEYPEGYGCGDYPVWWYGKLYTGSCAIIDFDP